MPDSAGKRLEQYFVRGRDKIGGWFGRIDAEIFRALLNYQVAQNLTGGIAEIGVHHGKSFVGLCLSLQEGERAYCVDIFENQQLNIDASGHGDKTILEDNLRRFGVDLKRLTIRAASSLSVSSAEILKDVGPVRFFSIDGGHWAEIVQHDLALAEESIADHGVIALDDFHRPEWPDVSAGYFAWASTRKKPLVPFCIGFNKLYLCHEAWRPRYQAVILEAAFLKKFLIKTAKFQGVNVPVFSEFLLPESGFTGRLKSLLRVFAPTFYVALRKFKSCRRR